VEKTGNNVWLYAMKTTKKAVELTFAHEK